MHFILYWSLRNTIITVRLGKTGKLLYKMLSCWLTLTAFLAGSEITAQAASGQEHVTFAPVCSIKSRPEVEITLPCGDGETAGRVQYWHTPFGGLQGLQEGQQPVFQHPNGSLVIPSSSIFHSGLYYCLLRGGDGTKLWQYQLHIHPTNQNLQDEESSECAAVKFKRSSEEPAGVSDQMFAGAVVASVLLTFVVGFSAGALSRTHVLRCFGSITIRIHPRHTDTPDHGSSISMTTKASPCTNQAFESESDSVTMQMTTLSNPSPPAKPQRSFRQKEDEAATYLEKCDHVEEEERKKEGGDVEGNIKGACDGEDVKLDGLHQLEDGGNQSGTDDEKHHGSEDGENTEGKMDVSLVAEENQTANVSEEDDKVVQNEKTTDKTTEETKEEKSRKHEDHRGDEVTESPSSAPSRRRHSRVIRLYQYDEDGQRFPHLPEPTLEDHTPAPKLKQRSISLTRLNTIMTAASARPLNSTESEEKLQFHMEI